ncbi:MAG: molybdate ABC transporter substrate-binding protein [Porticoccaceae bacterium]
MKRHPCHYLLAILLSLAALPGLAGDLVVSAAASLTNAFKDIAEHYEAKHPDAKVLLNFAASGTLLQQIAKGAPVDVFASADQETMDMAEAQGLVANAQRRDFARNALVLVVPADSAIEIAALGDLAQGAVRRVAIGNPASVPAGRYAGRALEQAGLATALQGKLINTQNVRQALDYVARGEVEAGFVYATDARLMADKVKVALEVPLDIAISYPIAAIGISSSENASSEKAASAAEATRFIDFVLSPEGQAVLDNHGFARP